MNKLKINLSLLKYYLYQKFVMYSIRKIVTNMFGKTKKIKTITQSLEQKVKEILVFII